MNEVPLSLPPKENVPEANWIDAVCLQYEQELRSGSSRLSEYVQACDASLREKLLPRLLLLEWEFLEAGEESVSPESELEELREWCDLIHVTWENFQEKQSSESPHTTHSNTGNSQLVETEIGDVSIEKVERDGIPNTIGRYRVAALLGRGAFGAVYQAEDDQLHRRVAIKVTHRVYEFQEELDQALQEAQLLAALEHPRIVPVYDVGQTESGQLFIVSKWIEGTDLAHLASQRTLSLDQMVDVVRQIAEGLAHAHQQGIYHRDIKPANILLGAQNEVYLADFGLAVHYTRQRQRRGEVSGTPNYMSPEQVRGEAQWLDGRSDLWSLGVLFYELLTGRLPFTGTNRKELFENILHHDPVPPRQINNEIPELLQEVTQRCLRKSADGRYASLSDLAAELQTWQLQQDSHTVKKPNSVTPRTSERRWWVIGLLVLVMMAGVMGIVRPLLKTQDTDPPNGPSEPAEPALQSELVDAPEWDWEIRVWNTVDPERNGLSVRNLYEALPAQEHDDWQLEVQLDRSLYLYLFWLDSDSVVTPLYPWKNFDWEQLSASQQPVEKLTLPVDTNAADGKREVYELDAGEIDCLLLLASETPIDASFPWKQAFAILPDLNLDSEDRIQEFNRTQIRIGRKRAPRVKQIANDLEQLRSHFMQHFSAEQFPLLEGLVIRKK